MSHALAYARAGLEVLPLMRGGKLPHRLAQHAKDSASSDVEQVRDWWAQDPDANIGIRPGSGIVVVDVDPRDGGASNLAALVRKHGHLSPTWTAWTGGGGLHAWYRAPGPYRGRLAHGVDLKSHTGYVVAPPSLHASGRRYEWGNNLPIAQAPRWLAELMVATPPVLRPVHAGMVGGPADDGLVRTVAQAPQGERNHLAFWAACRAMERGGAPELLERIAAAARANGLAVDEVDRTITSAVTRGGVSS